MLLLDPGGRGREATLGTFCDAAGRRLPALLAGNELLGAPDLDGWQLVNATPTEREQLRAAGLTLVALTRPSA